MRCVMSKVLGGCVVSLVVAWGIAEFAGRAIVYSDQAREESFEMCKASGGGNFGCVLDSMSSGDDGGVPWDAPASVKEAYKVGSAWYNDSLTEEQKSTYKGCIEESEASASEASDDPYVRRHYARESLKGCVITQLNNG